VPDLAGEDLDGVAFKLSDYRGKVVLLDFWAHWCGHCMEVVPHERSMVERLAGKPKTDAARDCPPSPKLGTFKAGQPSTSSTRKE
jgi:thiol-disulfide isomerase/thioredoxin